MFGNGGGDVITTETTTTTTESSSKVSPYVLMLGDVDCNLEVNVLDAVMLAHVAAEDTKVQVTDEGKLNADMNQDGSVKTDDLTALLRVLAGIK